LISPRVFADDNSASLDKSQKGEDLTKISVKQLEMFTKEEQTKTKTTTYVRQNHISQFSKTTTNTQE